jgi:signal transduction histidine kinase
LFLHKKYSPGLPALMIDRNVLKIVLQNLLSNAVKYTEPQGNITLTIGYQQGYLRISVADDGIGIPVSDQDKMFTKFFRANNVSGRNVQGTGLGLNLAQSLVRVASGEIWFESEEGKGTVFYAKIPAEVAG